MPESLLIDLSRHQADDEDPRRNIGPEDFDRWAAAGVAGITVRVSHGLDLDKSAHRWVALARAVDIPVGGYAYLLPASPGQAERYLVGADALGGLDWHAADCEQRGLQWGDVAGVLERWRYLMPPVAIGRYTRPLWWAAREPKGFDAGIFQWDWLADYRTSLGGGARWLSNWQTANVKPPPDAPPDWAPQPPGPFWQYGAVRYYLTVAGERAYHSVDGNVYAGSQLDFLRYVGAL